MNLSALIKKDGLAKAATATPATIATPEADQVLTVAEVATVAVTVKPEPQVKPKRQPASPELSADEESRIRAWLTHIEETIPAIIAEVLENAESIPEREPISFTDRK